jgi:hypothetical protein
MPIATAKTSTPNPAIATKPLIIFHQPLQNKMNKNNAHGSKSKKG